MRASARMLAVAFAIANLDLLYLTGPLVSPEHQLVFHLPGPAAPLFAAVLVNLLLLTAVFWALLAGSRRWPSVHLAVWAGLLLALPCVLVNTVADFAGKPAAPWAVWGTGLGGLVLWVGIVVWRRAVLPLFWRALPGLTTLMAFVALSGVLILGQLVWLGWRVRGMDAPFVAAEAHPSREEAAARMGHPVAGIGHPDGGATPARRVVWIVLDELSYRQVYGHRFPGLALPNFDRLAAESVVFSDAVAAGPHTRIAVPSLLTGRPMSATEPASDGRALLVHGRGAHRWEPLRVQDTVFGDVAAAGLATGVAGWYEPYCRLLEGVLDRCFWTYRDSVPGGMSPAWPLWRNTAEPWREGGLRLLHLAGVGPGMPSEGALDVERHAADTRELAVAGDRLLSEQRSGLVLLHMPIPHPWGFYDRRNGSYPAHRTSYVDNLALADAYLGHVRTLLEAQGTWDATDVVVMGDHGWRVWHVWRPSGFWTAEDEQASRGTAAVDAPAVVVKVHGEHSGVVSGERFDAVRTRALIGALLRGQVADAAGLVGWVAGQ